LKKLDIMGLVGGVIDGASEHIQDARVDPVSCSGAEITVEALGIAASEVTRPVHSYVPQMRGDVRADPGYAFQVLI
jgi:hypothetical protein